MVLNIDEFVLDGWEIYSEADFYREFSALLNFGDYYGCNLDALWGRLSTDVKRPVKIIWLHSELSRLVFRGSFDKIVMILEKIK
ncbi:barstar family protein [Klebsiella sp. RHBSTW-00484]|nr:barstar family protein [Klebsiella sp. RHBSTW-00465]QLO39885.1 barstar family protein [Klebsiella sp. RHBSTW-00484]QLT79404.1 barstar family protein [Klebsiella sp. RHBSTW-00464]